MIYGAHDARSVASSRVSGSPECPVHPTDLVFALDQSPGVTAQAFSRMKEMASAVLRDLRVRTGGCAVGARVAVLTYGGAGTQQLVRFSDALDQSQLLSTLQAIAHEAAASSGGGLGHAMRFISRHVFKRTLPGTHTRRVATFFSAGPADPSDAQELTTAAMELGALDIIPVVIAFGAVPAVRRAFAVRPSSCQSRPRWPPVSRQSVESGKTEQNPKSL